MGGGEGEGVGGGGAGGRAARWIQPRCSRDTAEDMADRWPRYCRRVQRLGEVYLGCISVASRLHLGCLSAASRLHLGCISSHLSQKTSPHERQWCRRLKIVKGSLHKWQFG